MAAGESLSRSSAPSWISVILVAVLKRGRPVAPPLRIHVQPFQNGQHLLINSACCSVCRAMAAARFIDGV